jgi:urease accessory protein
MIPANSSFYVLLFSNSTLLLGSFAFSSGLKSFIGNYKFTNPTAITAVLDSLLECSIGNVASTALLYVYAAYSNPSRLDDLDNAFDVSTPYTVARWASMAQGKTLLTIWKKARCTGRDMSRTWNRGSLF